MQISLDMVKENPVVNACIKHGDQHLAQIGYTDHGPKHVMLVSDRAMQVLSELGYSDREIEMAGIAGYIHDIGNVINREAHSQSGALMAYEILKRMDMGFEEVATITAAIGNHDEGSGNPVNAIAAALILADKSHVHRNRVRNRDISTFEIHDRVNYAAKSAHLRVSKDKMTANLDLTIDITICPVMEYFEIFLSRMLMCRQAANYLGCTFILHINGVKLL